jgi:sigma-B regulation protein RsbU (phosphoserine phosphatase)
LVLPTSSASPLPAGPDARGLLLEAPKRLYRLLDALVGPANEGRDGRDLLRWFLHAFQESLARDLRIRGAFLYGERRRRFRLQERAGDPALAVAPAFDASRPELGPLLGAATSLHLDPAVPSSPAALGLAGPQPAATLRIDEPHGRHLLLLLLEDRAPTEVVEVVLGTLQAVLAARMLQTRLTSTVRAATEIQRGLLPETPPPFPGFDLAAHSAPAEEVGGDFFDLLPLSGEVLGLAVGDASGHGFPAALVARDVVTGLRMGADGEMKVTTMLSRLNGVLHRSGPSRGFVSLFYGELDPGGALFYVNAGHPPALLVGAGGVEALWSGDTVLGPFPDVSFRRRVAHLERGSILVVVSDGILERLDAAGEMFGSERLREVVLAHRRHPAAKILAAIFRAAGRFGQDAPFEDDATALVVRRER